MRDFEFDRKIAVLTDGEAITFAHKSTFDDLQSHRLHINNYVEIYVYISGDTDYIIEDAYYTLQSGDVMIVTPHQAHAAVIKTPCQYERFYLLFPTHFFAQFRFDPLQALLRRSSTQSARLHLNDADRKKAHKLLKQMSSLCADEHSDSSSFEAFSVLMHFLCLLHNADKDTSSDAQPDGNVRLPELLHEILAHINANLTQIESVQQLADTFHVSLPYLSTLFSKHIGIPLSTYLRTRKIAYAKQLLESGQSVTNAA
ncbi:MAG: hypothetical protein IIY04_03910 [Oscillospiraceae bacterium]|nr:hypothetical protein [Oscillospiraceae bacterium]